MSVELESSWKVSELFLGTSAYESSIAETELSYKLDNFVEDSVNIPLWELRL